MERIKNIEILRFIFSLIVVGCHLRGNVLNLFKDTIPWYDKLSTNLTYAHLPVECFFIVAGFFLFSTTNFSQNFVDFAKKKLIRFMPLVLFTLGLYFIFSLFTPLSFKINDSLFTILNIQNVGLTLKASRVLPSWFISSLFWTMCFYFYLYKIVTKEWFNLITASIVFFCYSLWIHTTGPNFKNIYCVFNIGMLRAFAGVGLGYFISMFCQNYMEYFKNKTFSIFQKICITGFEGYFLGFIIYYMSLHKSSCNNHMIVVVSFTILFLLFILRKGFISNLLENNLSVFLGKFAFSIFITHIFVLNLWKALICKPHSEWIISHPILNLVLIFTSVICLGVASHYLVEKPATKYLMNKYVYANNKNKEF